jgi:post-segregation antitoxin (ccd killing protein)
VKVLAGVVVGAVGAVVVGALLLMGDVHFGEPQPAEWAEACAVARDVVDTVASPPSTDNVMDAILADLRNLTRAANRSGDPELERLARQARNGISAALQRTITTRNAKDAQANEDWRTGHAALTDLHRHCGREVPTASES